MSKVKLAHLIDYNSYIVKASIANIDAMKKQLADIQNKSKKQKFIDFFFCIIDEHKYLENSIFHSQNAVHNSIETIFFLKYYVKEEFVDLSDVPNVYAPHFYKFCAENNLTY